MRASHAAFFAALVLAGCGGASTAGSNTAGGGETTAGGGDGAPTVTLEAGRVLSGAADFEPSAAAVLRDRVAEIRTCYAQEVARDATLAGRVDVDFSVGTGGTVSEVQARTRGNLDAASATCVTGVVSPLVFAPPPAAVVTLRYTLVLAPR